MHGDLGFGLQLDPHSVLLSPACGYHNFTTVWEVDVATALRSAMPHVCDEEAALLITGRNETVFDQSVFDGFAWSAWTSGAAFARGVSLMAAALSWTLCKASRA